MPYIPKNLREPFDRVKDELLDGSDSDTFADRLAALMFGAWTQVYGSEGDPQKTRYYLQNELLGVTYACALEFARRVNVSFGEPERRHDWEKYKAEVADLAERLAALIPVKDEILRAGTQNYFITEVVIGAVLRKFCSKEDDLPALISGLGYEWYVVVTGPYEDGAIAKNGDTEGYGTLLPA